MSLHELIEKNQTPFLAMSRKKLHANYHHLLKSLPISSIHYAVKCNPSTEVLKELLDLGSNFEIASIYELNLLHSLGVNENRIIFSNPVKPAEAIRQAHKAGITTYAVDSFAEIEKISQNAPKAKIFIRIIVNDFSSRIPLSKKFGIAPSEAVEAMVYAQSRGLEPYGITFHVGSQSTMTELWDFAMQTSGKVLKSLEEVGIKLSQLNIGGGFPVEYSDPVPEIDEIGAVIERAKDEHLPYDIEIIAEPGRYMVADAGTLITSVIGRSVRGGKNWLYTDTSAFHGLLETMPCQGQIQYPISQINGSTDHKHAKFILTGPTCDNLDTYANSVELPLDIKEGDYLKIEMTGAYTLPFASHFNGFPPPKVVMYD